MCILNKHPRSTQPGSMIFAVPLTVLGLMGCIAVGPAGAQDARTILQNCINVYRGLNSYKGQASADMRETLPNGTLVYEDSFTTTLSYQKPNKLKLDFAMPTGGRTIICDGGNLIYYQSKAQTFSSTPVRAANLMQLSVPLLNFQVASRLDTFFFLAGNDIPASVTGFTRKPDETRNGRPVYVIVAHEPSKTTKAPITWTWMIDKQTNLLARVEGRLAGVPRKVRIVDKNKAVMKTITVNRVLAQNIINPQPNPPLDPKTFVFSPPPNSKRVKFDAEVKGK